MRGHFRGMALLSLMAPIGAWCPTSSAQEPGPPKPKVAWTTAVEPKPIGQAVKKGLDWIVEHQLKDGGWGQGDESAQMGGGAALRDRSNVADTSIAALALVRSGSTPKEGPYKDSVARAVRFVRGQVDASDPASLDVSPIKGTRVQQKLGPNIDTFLASILLAEVNGRMADPAEDLAVASSLDKVLGKIKAHQKADGTWDNRTGWAPILAQSMAGKGINRASQNGAVVPEALLARAESAATVQFAMASARVEGGGFAGGAAGIGGAGSFAGGGGVGGAGSFAGAGGGIGGGMASAKPGGADGRPGGALAGPTGGRDTIVGGPGTKGFSGAIGGAPLGGVGSAGVELYDRAASLSGLRDSVNTNATKVAELKKVVEAGGDKAKDAAATLERFKAADFACAEAEKAVVRRLDDKSFVAGFGSNGGEEFLSYMNIGESLVIKGGPDWKKWDDSMTANLGRVQNDDGSWTGHHCITGRTFCTSTALLVLLGDRTPVPAQAKGDISSSAAPK